MNFTAIDVETADSNRWSICQVGLVKVREGVISDALSLLIRPPENQYSRMNTQVHGINAEITRDAPTFDEIWQDLLPHIEGQLLVAHNAQFDIGCLTRTLEYYSIEKPVFEVDCTYEKTGRSLDCMCQAYAIDLANHHDALCDAKACAQVYMKLLNKEVPDFSNIQPREKVPIWEQPGHERISGDVLRPDLENGDPNSPFYGKKLVLTGVLEKITRLEAAEILKNLGADIDTGVTKRTNYIIAGKDPGPSKIKKARKYQDEGKDICILDEDEFLNMLE